MYAAPAAAAISDTIQPYVSVALIHDDNLLRLDDGQSIDGQRSDNYRQSIAGLQFDVPYGLQEFTGDAHVTRVAFSHFNEYDYTGKDARGEWAWKLGTHLFGHLGGVYSESLTPFSEQSSIDRNMRLQRKEYVDGTWLFHPSWQMRGSFVRQQFRYGLASQQYNNRDEDTATLGVDYLVATGSRIGVQLGHLKGSYPDGTLLGFLISDGYKQNDAKINIFWQYSAITQVQILAGRAKRTHEVFGERDQSGANGRVNAYWTPVAKVKLTGSAWREFSAVEGSTINSSLNKGVSAEATWQATSKLGVNGLLRREKRDFGTVSGVAVVSAPNDTLRTANLSVTYTPLPSTQIVAGIAHSARSGNFAVGSGNYKSNSVSLSAQIAF
ncbi:hypothetical protein GTP69_22020 [Duganella sp. CY42W]|uniref:Outer membrane beta-barrel protein n=2 Tax=Duganella levis TaxID=2692169 RepID=A0ABW9W576_9BURK|nr:hypothetical protein [Duganella levis]